MSVRIAKLNFETRIPQFLIGPAFYHYETKKHRNLIIKQKKGIEGRNRSKIDSNGGTVKDN